MIDPMLEHLATTLSLSSLARAATRTPDEARRYALALAGRVSRTVEQLAPHSNPVDIDLALAEVIVRSYLSIGAQRRYPLHEVRRACGSLATTCRIIVLTYSPAIVTAPTS